LLSSRRRRDGRHRKRKVTEAAATDRAPQDVHRLQGRRRRTGDVRDKTKIPKQTASFSRPAPLFPDTLTDCVHLGTLETRGGELAAAQPYALDRLCGLERWSCNLGICDGMACCRDILERSACAE
jgi:hypothetical protein